MTPDEAIANLQRETELQAELRRLSDELFTTPRPTPERVCELREQLGARTAEVWRLRRDRGRVA